MANSSPRTAAPGAAPSPGTGHIGVVTVTYNSATVLPEFFDSLRSQTCRDYTLYVIDNGSGDQTLELCRSAVDLPLVLLPNEQNLGVAEGNNQGIQAALAGGCEFVLLLNNDTVFGPPLFAELRDGLRQHGCAMVVPKIYYHDQPSLIWAAGGRFQRWRAYRADHYGDRQRDRGQFDSVRSVSYAPTCCVLIRREVFDRVGLMDPLYFVYFDDVDFMYRAMNAGLLMKYLPSCNLLHKVSALTGLPGSPFATWYGTRNRVYFLRKHLPAFRAALWVSIYRLHLFFRYLFRRDTKSTWDARRNAVAEGLTMGHSASLRKMADPPPNTTAV